MPTKKPDRRFFQFIDLDGSHIIYLIKSSINSALECLATHDLGDCEYVILKEISLAEAQSIKIKEDGNVISLSEMEPDGVFSNLT